MILEATTGQKHKRYSPIAEHCNIFVVPSLTMLFDDDGCILNLGGCICTETENTVNRTK